MRWLSAMESRYWANREQAGSPATIQLGVAEASVLRTTLGPPRIFPVFRRIIQVARQPLFPAARGTTI
jgi:hypothetical protein